MAKSNNKKMRLKPLPVAIMVILAVVIIVAFIVAEIHNSQKEEDSKKANVSLSEKELVAKGEVNVNIQNDAVKTEVEILFEDSAVPVGTSFKIMAIVTPSDTDKAIVWTSSNSDIVEVSSDGVINVKGIGTAAITATVGDVADAIAIEGIASVTSGSGNGYSVYTGSSVNSAGNTASGISSSGESGDSYNGSTSGNQSSGNTGSSGADSASGGGTGSSGADSTSGGGTGNSGAGSSSGGNSSDTSKGLTSSEISGVLTEQGFTPNVSNVYVYNDNGTYCGEIVIQPNVTIIYIKQRSSGFDSKIQSVLKELLPTEYNQVWNNYLSATTDRTFTVENRKVRLVTAGKGGHSQIVIYN
ncbi:MAG: Ig-like domain-containing protein [Eubacteriales bacterium]|nr:Ig-like domain-containing protein [Eubacteriales bacterium]